MYLYLVNSRMVNYWSWEYPQIGEMEAWREMSTGNERPFVEWTIIITRNKLPLCQELICSYTCAIAIYMRPQETLKVESNENFFF